MLRTDGRIRGMALQDRLVSVLDELFRKGHVQFRKLRGAGPPYKFWKWATDRSNALCLYYEFPSRNGKTTNRKRVPVDEILAALREIVSEGCLTRKAFRNLCPVAESAGPCGFAVVGGCLELLGIARQSGRQGAFELTDRKRAHRLLEQRDLSSSPVLVDPEWRFLP
jgi:hypothetical protein